MVGILYGYCQTMSGGQRALNSRLQKISRDLGDRLTINSFIVTTFSGLSVMAGFGFDILIAKRFGMGREADAYFTAVTIPVIILTAILTASQSVLVVALSTHQTRGRENAAPDLFSSLMILSGLTGLLLAVIGISSARILIHLISPGFDNPSLVLATSLTQILFLRAPAATVVEIIRPALFAHRHFSLASAGYLIDSVIALLGLFFLPIKGVLAAGWAITLGTWVELIFLALVLWITKSGFFKPTLSFRDPALSEVGRAIAAPLGGLLFRQSVIIAERWFGSFLGPGSVAALGYANKIIKVLGGVVFDSVNTAGLPSLARALSTNIQSIARREWQHLLRWTTIAAIPLGLGLALGSRYFIRLFFITGTRNLGSVTISQMTALLAIYSLALIPLGPFRAVQSYLYAAKRPVFVGGLLFLATIITLLLDWPFIQLFGVNGLGWSFAAGLVISLVFGFIFIHRHINRLEPATP